MTDLNTHHAATEATLADGPKFARELMVEVAARIERELGYLSELIANPQPHLDYVVMSAHGLAMAYGKSNRKPTATNVLQASRFPQSVAERMASITHDGTGEPFKAWHVVDAAREMIKRDEDLLAILKHHYAKPV